MIIIAYAITPVVRRIIKNVSDKNVLIFGSALALASGVVPIITALFGVDTQYYMQTTGFLGVYLIGGALTEYKLSKTGRRLLYTAGILGVIATFVFTAIWSFNSGRAQTVLFNHVSPNNVLTAAAVYVFAISGGGKAQIKSEKVANGCHSLAQVCFSVYLIHEVFVIFIEAGALSVASTRHTAVAIVLYSLTVFICSACVAMLIKQIPVVKKYIS